MLVPFSDKRVANVWKHYQLLCSGKCKLDRYGTNLRENGSGSVCNLVVPGHALQVRGRSHFLLNLSEGDHGGT